MALGIIVCFLAGLKLVIFCRNNLHLIKYYVIMKNILKIWLVDNTVTVENKDDKIGQLESSGNLSLQDILDEMHYLR